MDNISCFWFWNFFPFHEHYEFGGGRNYTSNPLDKKSGNVYLDCSSFLSFHALGVNFKKLLLLVSRLSIGWIFFLNLTDEDTLCKMPLASIVTLADPELVLLRIVELAIPLVAVKLRLLLLLMVLSLILIIPLDDWLIIVEKVGI